MTPRDGQASGWRAAAVCFVVLFAVGTYLPAGPGDDYTFGFATYARLAGWVFPLAAAMLVLLLFSRRAAQAVGSAAARLSRSLAGWPGRILGVVAFFGATLLFVNRSPSGDATSVLVGISVDSIYPSNALTCYLFRLVVNLGGLDPVSAVQLTSSLSGAVYAACAIGLGVETAPPGIRRTGTTAVLLAAGFLAIFFGTVEVYAPLVAAVALYLLFAARWLNGRGPWWAAPAALGLAATLHGSAVFLGPTLLYVAARGRLRELSIRRILAFGGACLAPVLAVAALVFFEDWKGVLPAPGPDMYGTALGAEGRGPFLPLAFSPHDPIQRYAILDVSHFAAMFNLLILYAPAGLVLRLMGRRAGRHPVAPLAGLAAALLTGLLLVWNVSFSLERDWDLFSLLGLPITLWGAVTFFARERARAAVVRAVALSLFCGAPFVAANSLGPTDGMTYEALMATQLVEGEFILASRDAARIAEEEARERGLEFDLGGDVPFLPDVRRLVQRVLVSTGSYAPTEPTVDPDAVRRGLETHGLEPTVALELATELARLTEKMSRSGRRCPPVGVIAWMAVRGAFPRVPEASESELSLLDALDEVMARREGFSYRRRTVPSSTRRREFLSELGVRRNQTGKPVDAQAWAEVLTAAADSILSETSEDREVYKQAEARLSKKDAEWSGPPYRAALDRAVWLAEHRGLPPATRYRFAEGYALQALARQPDEPEVLYVLGAIQYNTGRREEAIETYRRSIRVAPVHLPSRINLALALLELGRDEEAFEVLKTGVRIGTYDPRASEALVILAKLHLKRGEKEIARSVLEAAETRAFRAADEAVVRRRIEEALLLTAPDGE